MFIFLVFKLFITINAFSYVERKFDAQAVGIDQLNNLEFPELDENPIKFDENWLILPKNNVTQMNIFVSLGSLKNLEQLRKILPNTYFFIADPNISQKSEKSSHFFAFEVSSEAGFSTVPKVDINYFFNGILGAKFIDFMWNSAENGLEIVEKIEKTTVCQIILTGKLPKNLPNNFVIFKTSKNGVLLLNIKDDECKQKYGYF
ncbi:unnamed protein product [Caenorhabditis angaria]|uniref:DUF38 domain-containing protein n=1 Tax=Caenorhabditis angaria TaxID=860376 RepID=A0A9P1IVM0_9PELO|nr:unnamed protein product [Caenorhabditis angaria]